VLSVLGILADRARHPQIRVLLHRITGVSVAQRAGRSPEVGRKIAALTLHSCR